MLSPQSQNWVFILIIWQGTTFCPIFLFLDFDCMYLNFRYFCVGVCIHWRPSASSAEVCPLSEGIYLIIQSGNLNEQFFFRSFTTKIAQGLHPLFVFFIGRKRRAIVTFEKLVWCQDKTCIMCVHNKGAQ